MAVDISPPELAGVVARSLGRTTVDLVSWTALPDPHPVENMTTSSLDRVTGTLTDGTGWSLFAKTLHPASCSSLWSSIPAFARQEVLEELDWTDEPRAYRCGIDADLPDDLRLPRLWHVTERPDRVVLWLEDVPDHGVWDRDAYARAAHALGRMAGRWPEHRVAAELGLRRRALDGYVEGRIAHAVLPLLDDDATWADPAVASAVAEDPDLRSDLAALTEQVPALLGRLRALPHALAHGDACPGNFRDPGDGLVLLDWSFGATGPVGSDLAQLVAGRPEGRDAIDPATIAASDAVVVDAFTEGVHAEGLRIERAEVEAAYAITLALRSAFTAVVPAPVPGRPDDVRAGLLRQRVALARLALDRVAAVA